VTFGSASPPAEAASQALLAGFQSPPQVARPRVWWHWMNGNITAEGAALDLAWMKRIGLGGAHIFSGGLPEPTVVPTPMPFMSDGWRGVFRAEAGSAARDGLEVGIAGSPGWSETGGIWVAPEDAMKKYVWSEVQAEGGRPLSEPLPLPPHAVGPFLGVAVPSQAKELKGDVYRDAKVIAFPTPADETASPEPTYVSNAGALDLRGLRGDLSSSIKLMLESGSGWIEARYSEAVTLSALTLGAAAPVTVRIQASDDGQAFRTIREADTSADGTIEKPCPEQTVAFDPTRARAFRVTLTPIPKRGFPVGPPPHPTIYGAEPTPSSLTITAFALSSGARIDRFEAKAGFQSTLGEGREPRLMASPAGAVRPDQVLDLSAQLRPDGRLNWTPPPGRWTIVRIGWSLTGQTNGPAEAAATGLEVDKLNRAAVRRYIDAYLGQYDAATGGRLERSGIQTLLTDSWEAGFQNWTPGILDEFRRRRGYDAVPYLPALAGRVVGSRAASDGFLWDYRLTLKELLAENHYGVLREALHARGLTYYSEAQGDTPRAIGDGLAMKAHADIPTAEYWYRPFATAPGQPSLKADLEEAASAAHLYGKPLVAAESLTVAAVDDPWGFSPRMLQPVADEIFARGVNRIIIHESHLQPLVDAKPGLEMLIFGQTFTRNESWADEAKPWVDYLARTSYLLQQGRFVADVAYFYGEERNLTERFLTRFEPGVPDGYHYDFVDRDALLKLLSVKDGAIVTPSGMRYRVLYLPPDVDRLSLTASNKIRDLVRAGAVLVGPKPVGGLGLQSSDAHVRAIADELWGPRSLETGRRVGKGRVYGPDGLQRALSDLLVAPDVEIAGRSADGEILSLHRRTADADIYFLSNQRARTEKLGVTFRAAGRAPEVWAAETGAAEAMGYRQSGGRTRVHLELAPNEAVFVVFQRKAPAATWSPPARRVQVLQTISGPWDVAFEPRRGAPAQTVFDRLISWPESSDAGVKYFSGHATYRKTVELPAAALRGGARIQLDLGDVREIATVAVNGKPVGTAWHPPYKLDITKALRPGANELAITVVNLWPNRIIGDKQPGATPITFAPQARYSASSPLLPSGLLGPVRLIQESAPRIGGR
jgi:hypothetical protein